MFFHLYWPKKQCQIYETMELENMNRQPPYIAGPYVGGTQKFIGRVDILQKVQNILFHHQESAILLHGQRRIGKTSVLKELETNLLKEEAYHPIYFDLLGKARQSLEETLRDLANTINSGLGKTEKADLGNNPKTEFRNVWLPNLLNYLNTKSLVLLFDEFDALDDFDTLDDLVLKQNAPALKQISDEFFHYVRDLLTINTQRLFFVFVIGRNISDLHDIALALCRELSNNIHVSLLDKKDTRKLIGFSIADKSLEWSEETIEKVWQLTHGHPLLTQALCKEIWERLYNENPKKPPVVTLKDIEIVIPKALESNESGLVWLWKGLPPAERVVISALAGAGAEIISASDLELLLKNSGARMFHKELENAQYRLLQQEELKLIEPVDGGYCFRVELLRRWIEKYKPLSQVREELEKIIPDADNAYQTGRSLYSSRQLDKAVSSLQKATRLNPNHNRANELLVEIYLAKKKTSDACEILEKLYENQPSAATRDRLIQAWLTLAQDSDDEDEQIRFYKQVLELDAEHIEAKNQLPKTWERQGDKASEAGDLGTALTAYRNAGLDDKGAEIEQKIRQQTQSYQQTQEELKTCYNEQKRLKWNWFPIILGVMFVIIAGSFWKYQQLQIQLERQKVENEHLSEKSQQLTIRQEEQKKEIKNLQETKEWYEFVSSLNVGDYWVMVGPYNDEQTTEKESKKITNQPPELPLEVIPYLFDNKWNVKIGKNYSQKDAEKLVVRIKELYLIKNVYTINPDCKTGFECLLKSLEKGNHRVIIGTYFKDQSDDAKRRTNELNKKYPELKVRRYRTTTKRNWRLYIGCYTSNSAERLQKWVAEDAKIAKEAYITECF